MEKLTKDELKLVARILRDHVPASIDIALSGHDSLSAREFAERVRPLDKQLADKMVAWHDATTGLAKYVRDRLGESEMHDPADILLGRPVRGL